MGIDFSITTVHVSNRSRRTLLDSILALSYTYRAFCWIRIHSTRLGVETDGTV